jgi:hypothetical protein
VQQRVVKPFLQLRARRHYHQLSAVNQQHRKDQVATRGSFQPGTTRSARSKTPRSRENGDRVRRPIEQVEG